MLERDAPNVLGDLAAGRDHVAGQQPPGPDLLPVVLDDLAVRCIPRHCPESRHRPASSRPGHSRPGAGTIVTAPRPPADRARGVLEAALVQAPQPVAAQLGAEPMTEVIRRQAAVREGGRSRC